MKKLVAFFSASGVTAKAAAELAGIIGADVYEIVPKVPYTAADLDWMDRKSRSSLEMKDQNSRPELKGDKQDLTRYDSIYIGFPIWWGVAPRIINTFIEDNDFSGKEIVIFATSGGSALSPAVKDLQKRYPGLDIKEGKLLNGRVTGDIV